MSKKLGILLSGRGSNFLAIHRSIQEGRIPASIGCVISNKRQASGFTSAREAGIPAFCVPARGPREEYEQKMLDILAEHEVDVVCLAGYMRILSSYFLRSFRGPVLNIHPALLPSFPGLDAQRQALEYGVKVSGCTVHLVDEGVDTGPVIMQAVVQVLDHDDEASLAARILRKEHILYTEAINFILKNQYVRDGRRIVEKK
jgi:phosphoribosylglycinamide formyltransferase-1